MKARIDGTDTALHGHEIERLLADGGLLSACAKRTDGVGQGAVAAAPDTGGSCGLLRHLVQTSQSDELPLAVETGRERPGTTRPGDSRDRARHRLRRGGAWQ